MTNLENFYILLLVITMNKEFSNIIIFNNETLDFIVKKIEKMILDLEYTKCNESDASIKIDLIQDTQNNICIISSDYLKFEDLATNKSIIRKISKRVAQDTFMATSCESIAVIEKYSFNKRIYDYISFGASDKLKELGYDMDSYAHQIAWLNHFVGRNNIENLNDILKDKKSYFNNYEIIIDILKLYGIKQELITYRYNDNISNHEFLKKQLFFK